MTDGLRPEEFVSAFLDEADELVRSATRHLLALDDGALAAPARMRAIREAFRALHTVKGLAAMVGFEPIVQLAHALETVLRAADRAGTVTDDAAEALLQGARGVEAQLREVAEGKPPTPASPALLEHCEGLASAAQGEVAPSHSVRLPADLRGKLTDLELEHLVQGAAAAGQRAVRVDFTPSPANAEAGLNITTVRERLSAVGELVKVVPLAIPASPAAPGGLLFSVVLLTQAAPQEVAAAAGLPEGAAQALALAADPVGTAALLSEPGELRELHRAVVRVEVSRLDDAMDRLSELIVSRFRLTRAVATLAAQGINVRELAQIVAENSRQLREMRAAVLRLRMVRVADMLERVPLIVRSLRRTTGKPVRLQMDAGTAEVEKSVGEKLFPALVHLVRNGIDHAIETPQERQAAGKPAEGTLTLTCLERSNAQLELSVSDDGRGVDRQAVAARAGVPVPGTDQELLDLLCRPGLSTRARADTTSGRGMGMDIVRRVVVEELGGTLLLRTQKGFGTTFTVRVPLTISIVDAFSFESDAQRFVVPVAMVEEVLEVHPDRLIDAPSGPGGSAVPLLSRRGEAVPLLDLVHAFGHTPAPARRQRALVVRRSGEALAFAVDRLLGQQEVVVRPLEDALVRQVGVAGSTDLGDGRPTLVLDLVALGGELLSRRSKGEVFA